MRIAILAFAAGTAWLQFQARLPPAVTIYLLLGAGILIFLCLSGVRHNKLRFFLLITAGLACGVGWAAMQAQRHLADSLPAEWEGRDIVLTGVIDSLPDRFEQGVRFNFRVERAVTPRGEIVPVPRRIALAWYAGFNEARAESVAQIEPGERWRLTVRLRRPHGNANPYGFDYEVWLLEQSLRATGYVRAAQDNARLDSFVPSLGNAVERCRALLRSRILAALSDKPYAGVIVALVVGDQRTISRADWQVFHRTGVGHLISISGLHITMVAGLFAALASFLWRRSFFTAAALPLLLPAHKAAALAGTFTALLYVLLAGFGVPAQRTLYMVSVVALALWCGRLTSISHVLCAALGLVLLLDPWALLWPGFWLSFGAVAIILFATVGRVRPPIDPQQSRGRRWLAALRPAARMQYVVTVGLVPLSVLLFGQLSLVSPLANAIAIPLVSFVVTPLALIGSVLPLSIASGVLGAAHGVVAGLADVLGWLSRFPWAVWSAPAPSLPMFACALIGTAWLLAPRGWPARWLGALAMLPLALHMPVHPAPGDLRVTAFDVGQGMALLIETSGHRLLYDTGPYYSPESNGASRVLLPYLTARGIHALDGLIISHSDNDHSGGALTLLRELDIGWVASSLAIESAIVRAAPRHHRCLAGQRWNWDGVDFEMLHPSPASYANATLKPNARSCTLKITRGAHAILLAGDIEAPQEAQLVRQYGAQLKASVLLAPHHGSGTSSTTPFLNAVQPQVAVFQVGYRNRYHHPKAEVFDRYGRLGVRRLRTDDSGALTFDFTQTSEDPPAVTSFRDANARYWHPPRQ